MCMYVYIYIYIYICIYIYTYRERSAAPPWLAARVCAWRKETGIGHVNMCPQKHVPLDFENREILSTL